MSSQYSREMLKVAVARICQTIGWHSINSTPFEIMTDILCRYITQVSKSTHDYANEFGFLEPNLDHLGLVFRDMHVNLQDLGEYVTYVDAISNTQSISEFPVQTESHLNFLKPGSKEVVTRPVYIHEHLPPMHPDVETNGETPTTEKTDEVDDKTESTKEEPYFKRPAELTPSDASTKRPRLCIEEEGRPTREISSVMMTTSGFLSPAREGKLPEARTPLPTHDNPPIVNRPTQSIAALNIPSAAPLDQSPAPSPPVAQERKPPKVVRRVDKRKQKAQKVLKKSTSDERPVKTRRKNTPRGPKVKTPKGANSGNVNNADAKPSAPSTGNGKASSSDAKVHKALVAARMKTEKFNTTITPILAVKNETTVDGKLSSEPDKNKLNIFKKISNVKNEKVDKIEKITIKVKDEMLHESRESSPDLIIDESQPPLQQKKNQLDVVSIELINSSVAKSTDAYSDTMKSEKHYLDDYFSPPGTPSTPKTPEMVMQLPPVAALVREKRKRKDKTKVKKVKAPKVGASPRRAAPPVEVEMERPKTPELLPNPVTNPGMFHFFPPLACSPGLIPSALHNPLFMPALGKQVFGQPPHIPPPIHFMQPSKVKEEASPTHVPDTTVADDPPVASPEPRKESPPLAVDISPKPEKKSKEHKKEKKDKVKKKNKKDKIKNKSEKRKLKEEKKEKGKIKKEKREKRKEKELAAAARETETAVPKLTLKLGSASPRPITPDAPRKLLIKPVVKKEEDVHSTVDVKREPSPELAKISALVTGHPKLKTPKEVSPGPTRTTPGPGRPRIHPQKPTKTRPAAITDNDGNKVWICPACGGQDDGSPMIGCDDCDAWYHWVCVGIQVPPDDNEDWYCRKCIAKKQETMQFDKKKKRKKKEKKDVGFE